MEKANNNDEDGAAAASSLNLDEQQQQHQATSSVNGTDFQITLNDFLEFLKLSCHVNDMIAKADNKPHNREPVPPAESAAGVVAKRNSKKDEFDFSTLAENHLVNELLALKRPHGHSGALSSREESSRTSLHKSSLRPSHVHTGRGLHPKLNEQLDYVINEGVLDSVLSFICPLPLPVAFTNNGRAKLGKQQQQQQPQSKAQEVLTVPSSSSVVSSKSMTELGYATTGTTSSTSVSSPREHPTSGDSNGMVRALVKEPSGKGTTNPTARRKSLLLAKDSKHARQEKKE